MHAEHIGLKPGSLIPDFYLASFKGRGIHPSDYRGHKNLVMVFAGDPAKCEPVQQILAGLTRHYAEFIQENAEVLAVIRGTPQEADRVRFTWSLPFPVLADEDGQAHMVAGALISGESSASSAPAVYIIDRYNEISAVYRTSQGDPLPTIREILRQILFIEIQCPE